MVILLYSSTILQQLATSKDGSIFRLCLPWSVVLRVCKNFPVLLWSIFPSPVSLIDATGADYVFVLMYICAKVMSETAHLFVEIRLVSHWGFHRGDESSQNLTILFGDRRCYQAEDITWWLVHHQGTVLNPCLLTGQILIDNVGR